MNKYKEWVKKEVPWYKFYDPRSGFCGGMFLGFIVLIIFSLKKLLTL